MFEGTPLFIANRGIINMQLLSLIKKGTTLKKFRTVQKCHNSLEKS